MTQSGWQNTKVALLVAALLLGAKLDHHRGAEQACAACDPEVVVPVLQEEADVIAQDGFQGKDA
jgi:hypothetical protein